MPSKNQTTSGRANCVKKCDAPAMTQKWPVVSRNALALPNIAYALKRTSGLP